MVNLLDIGELGINKPLEHWWQWAFIGIAASSALVGILCFLLVLLHSIRKWSKSERKYTTIPPRLKAFLEFHENGSTPIISEKSRLPASSFGVYLGPFETQPTQAEIDLLSRWDILILDPLQVGVHEAIANIRTSAQNTRIGRLHLRELHAPSQRQNDQDIIVAVEKVRDVIEKRFRNSNTQSSSFAGILLAGWEEWLPIPIFDALVQYVRSNGLDVYLEIAPPNFLGKDSPNMAKFAGVVVRNGTILTSGHVRDYFQMAVMKSTVKAFVTQTCLREFRVMVWETVDDEKSLSHSVIKRCYIWCRYYSAMVFITSKGAVYDPASEGILEPLAAFQWLKDQRVMKLHNQWRSTHQLISNPTPGGSIAKLEQIVPSLKYLTPVLDLSEKPQRSDKADASLDLTLIDPAVRDEKNSSWFRHMSTIRGSPISFSPSGKSYSLLGCFPIGLHVTQDDYNQIVQTQRHLLRMGKLDQIKPSKLRAFGALFRKLHHDGFTYESSHIDTNVLQCLDELAQGLWASSDSEDILDPIEVYIGLDSGFRTPDGAQFWAVSDVDAETGSLTIYVSRYASDHQSTLLHAYLSNRGCSRHACFATEIAVADAIAGRPQTSLPKRFVQDIKLLTPSDIILFFQHLKVSDQENGDTLVGQVRSLLEEQILDGPSFAQLRELDTAGYLSGKIPEQMIIESRGLWYEKHGYQHFDIDVALKVFRDVAANFVDILCSRRHDDLEKITDVLESVITAEGFDAYSDIVALAIFCAARKAAFNEIYLEVSDRNPLFNEYSDQAGAFSELFALGSRCEDYFDLTPSAFGKILSDRHREHYSKPHNQPPLQIEYATGYASSYAVAQIDIDDTVKEYEMPAYQRLTYLSVFAIPAFIDIMLLTTTGHGLYLSSFMSDPEKRSATIALMISLPLSSAIGTWIAIGGSYYLNSVAFPAANMYIITRLTAGLVVMLTIGLSGFVIVSAVFANVRDGIVFLLYFTALTTYLTLLAVLSSYQYLGSSFQNGRTIILSSVPILFVAPIITLFVEGYDTVIYLIALYIFIGVLVLGARRIGSQWVNWYHTINAIDDNKLKEWYVKVKGQGNKDVFSGMTDPAALVLARSSLLQDVKKERAKRIWMPATPDPLVNQLAKGWEATIFLLEWYCRLQGSKQPIPYSSTWNVQVKVGLASLIEAQRGIRLHNSFVLWRQAGDEVICGVLYFLIALLDRWVELLSGGNLLGLAAGNSNTVRKATGLGLAYYLIGSVILDYRSYSLIHLIEAQSPEPIRSAEFIRDAVVKTAKTRRNLYFSTLGKFLSVHVWSLALTTAILFILDGTLLGLEVFGAFVGCYSGLLLYQASFGSFTQVQFAPC
ncbi:hypothetical protein WAI453_010347 [Rhynchosporium graminicola]